MNYNDSIDNDPLLKYNEKQSKKINLNHCKIEVLIADSSLPHGINYCQLTNYYINNKSYKDEHYGEKVYSEKYGSFLIKLNHYQIKEASNILPMPISTSKIPTMRDLEQYWLIKKKLFES